MTYTPFAPRVDDPVAQHKSTSPTDKVPTAEFLYDVGVRIPAVGTYESHRKIGPECRLYSFLKRLSKGKRLRVRHEIWWLGDRADEGETGFTSID